MAMPHKFEDREQMMHVAPINERTVRGVPEAAVQQVPVYPVKEDPSMVKPKGNELDVFANIALSHARMHSGLPPHLQQAYSADSGMCTCIYTCMKKT